MGDAVAKEVDDGLTSYQLLIAICPELMSAVRQES